MKGIMCLSREFGHFLLNFKLCAFKWYMKTVLVHILMSTMWLKPTSTIVFKFCQIPDMNYFKKRTIAFGLLCQRLPSMWIHCFQSPYWGRNSRKWYEGESYLMVKWKERELDRACLSRQCSLAIVLPRYFSTYHLPLDNTIHILGRPSPLVVTKHVICLQNTLAKAPRSMFY